MPVAAISCAVVFIPWEIVRVLVTPLPDTVQEQLDDAIKYGLNGIIVYVDQSDAPSALYAAGLNNREHQVPANPEALFKIASISKLYIAAAAAKMVNAGYLSLDDALTDHLPELAGSIENAEQITVRMLLQHRSGIPNFTDDPNFPWSNPPEHTDDALKLVLNKPADFSPDNNYRYSNTNYLLIGDILDKTLGYGHQEYIKNEILTPLGLTQTYGQLDEVALTDVVSGYYYDYDEDIKEADYIIPGGSMVATAQDVGIFLRALNDGSFFNEEEQAIYASVYGYEHTGLLPGYQSIARYHKDLDAVVVQFNNISGGNLWTVSDLVYKRIVRILSKE